jgi:hypothetical protein
MLCGADAGLLCGFYKLYSLSEFEDYMMMNKMCAL